MKFAAIISKNSSDRSLGKKRGKNIYKINLISSLPQTELFTEFKIGNSPYAFWTERHCQL